MYADGVAATQFEFGRYSSEVLRNQPYAVTDTVLKQGAIGLLTTHPHEAFATDSAATASAMSTGVKTTIGAIGVGPDGKPVRTAAQAAKVGGKHYRPHHHLGDLGRLARRVLGARQEPQRRREHRRPVLALEPTVILGGGADFFLPKPGGKRDDGKDVIAGFRAKGYTIARNAAELRAAGSGRLLGLFSDESLDHTIDRTGNDEPTLAEMTRWHCACWRRTARRGSSCSSKTRTPTRRPPQRCRRTDARAVGVRRRSQGGPRVPATLARHAGDRDRRPRDRRR